MHDAERELVNALLTPFDGPTSAAKETRRSACLAILDSVGVAVGTMAHPAAVIARGHVDTWLSHNTSATVWGGGAASVDGALLANAVGLRCYDFNDVLHGVSGQAGHPSDFVPGLFAVAEAGHLSGQALLDATILAYDATSLLFDGVNVAAGGWDYANLVGLGSIAGLAPLLGLTTDQAANALGIFGTTHLATNQIESGDLDATGNLTMWKRFNGAQAARSALEACRFAASGVEPPINSLLGEHGFLVQQGIWPEAIDGLIEQQKATLQAGVRGVDRTEFKRWPVGTRAQSAISAALACHEQLPAGCQIDQVVVQAEQAVIDHLVRPESWEPYSRETADHSLPFSVAAALLYGDVDLEHFDVAVITSEELRRLLAVTRVEASPDGTPGHRSAYPATVTITSAGKEFVGTGEYPPDEIRAIPFEQALRTKFDAMTGRRFGPAVVEEIREQILALDELEDVSRLGDLLGSSSH